LGNIVFLLLPAALGILDVNFALICFIFAAAIRTGFGWWWIRSSVDFTMKPDWRTVKNLGLMGIRLSWVDLMVLLNAQVTITIIRCMVGDFESVGYFSRGQRIAMLAVTAGQSVLPLLFSRWASFPQENLNLHVQKVMRFSSTLSIFMTVVLLLTARWLILILYGSEFLKAVGPTMILVPGTVLYLNSYILVQLIGSRGSPEIAAGLLFFSAIVNGLLTWLLIPVMNINGAATAVTISNIVLLIGLVFIVRKRFSINIARCLLMTRGDIRSIIKELPWGKTQYV
jgi:O-antigen/teichoic acid export membrane protein